MKLKYFIFKGFALISIVGFSQEVKSPKYRVVERIQIQECVNSEAPSCTQANLEKSILPILEKYLRELPVDTLKLYISFTVGPEGEMKKSDILKIFCGNFPKMSYIYEGSLQLTSTKHTQYYI